MPDLQASDLRVTPPRRWSEELGGIRWLPRMIDKAKAAVCGTLGDYLYGQCPMDRDLLRTLGLTYRDFTAAVRAGVEDEAILAILQQRCGPALEAARRWSDGIPRRNRIFLFLIDVDDGYAVGVLHFFRALIRFFSLVLARYARYHSPARATLIGLEIEAQAEGERAEAARGADQEPYSWLTAKNLDYSWKILLSVVLIFLIFSEVIRFIERIGIIFIIIIGAIFFAYLIYPVVRWLNRRLPLLLAILCVYAGIAGLVAVGLLYLIPAVTSEVTTLTHEWPRIQNELVAFVRDPHNPIVARLPAPLRDELARLPSQVPHLLQKYGASAAGNAFVVLIGTAAFIGACVAIPVLGAYLLYDSETAKRLFMGFIPTRRRAATLELLSQLERVIGGFIRGQLLVGASVGALIAVGLTLVGEPYAILIGAIAGVLDLIPYVGPIMASIPAIIIAFVAGGLPLALKAIVVFVLANQAEGHIIAPNIVSRTIQLSPSAVVIAILIGGELYGIVGMFIAVPVAGIIRVLLLHVIPGSVSRDEARPVLTKDPHEAAEEAASS